MQRHLLQFRREEKELIMMYIMSQLLMKQRRYLKLLNVLWRELNKQFWKW